uniref:Uncharacterized protein n=1 Tax=Picea glauca TaxID=3330 RepID=A0A101M3H5_PICGL|nr:hypothetical protein ABT39_MTgene88 [Picea glauca]KUM50252.1 hypothetical protein ABT39_MTgene95 [Picea glauca]
MDQHVTPAFPLPSLPSLSMSSLLTGMVKIHIRHHIRGYALNRDFSLT